MRLLALNNFRFASSARNQSQLVKLAKRDTGEGVEPHYYWLLPGNRQL
jgi:hypothetical protein